MNNFKDCLYNKSDSKDDPASERILEVLENIDDDCDRNGIILVIKFTIFWSIQCLLYFLVFWELF